MFGNAEADFTRRRGSCRMMRQRMAIAGFSICGAGVSVTRLTISSQARDLDPQNPLYMYAAARSLVAMDDASAVAFYTEAISRKE